MPVYDLKTVFRNRAKENEKNAYGKVLNG